MIKVGKLQVHCLCSYIMYVRLQLRFEKLVQQYLFLASLDCMSHGVNYILVNVKLPCTHHYGILCHRASLFVVLLFLNLYSIQYIHILSFLKCQSIVVFITKMFTWFSSFRPLTNCEKWLSFCCPFVCPHETTQPPLYTCLEIWYLRKHCQGNSCLIQMWQE
jgi:hypothetical protein